MHMVARTAQRQLRVGLIGYGTIGKYVAEKLLDGRTLPGARLAAVLVKRQRARDPVFGSSCEVFTNSADSFFDAKWDIAVEAAGQSVVREHGLRCLSMGRNFLLTSVGALCDDSLHEQLCVSAAENRSQLMLAAGAMPAMDWMSSAALEHLEEVLITQTKRPEGWVGTPAEERVNLASLAEPSVVFHGCAREAATLFPKNANVAAALALATTGLDKTQVQLVADPGAVGPKINVHLRGAAGELDVEVKGRPAFGSPRTSMIVPLSVVKALRNLSSSQFTGL